MLEHPEAKQDLSRGGLTMEEYTAWPAPFAINSALAGVSGITSIPSLFLHYLTSAFPPLLLLSLRCSYSWSSIVL